MFQLTKVWVDPSPHFENVEIRYTWTPLGEPGKFSGEEDTEVMAVVPNTNPRVRQAILEIPRYLKKQGQLPISLSVHPRRYSESADVGNFHRGNRGS